MASNLLLHAVAAATFCFCTYYDSTHLFIRDKNDPEYEVAEMLMAKRKLHGGRWKYLTVWGLTVQQLYYLLALVNDLVGSSSFRSAEVSRLQRLRDVFFSSIALPIAMLVGLMFWGLYAVDRDLVFPAILDNHYPLWLNHGVHTLPAVFGFLELFTVRHNMPSNRVCLTLLCSFLLGYLGWSLYLALVKDLWVYGIMQVLSWPMRILFMAVNLMVALSLFFLGKACDVAAWGSEKAAAEKINTKVEGKKRR